MSEARPTSRDELAELLRSCVQCGLCLPHCATYLATGNEVQSPRGRLLLLGEVLAADSDRPAAESFLAAFDQCIGCRACETVCPSGVPFSLLAHGQELAAAAVAAAPGPAVPGFLLHRLDSATALRLLDRIGRVARGVLKAFLGRRWRLRLDRKGARVGESVRLLGSMPTAPATDATLVRLLDGLTAGKTRSDIPTKPAPPPSAAGRRVLFFRGCANDGFLAATSVRLLNLLERSGCRVEIPAGQECCGALASHTGRPGRAAVLKRRNTESFAAAGELPPSILVEAAGCGVELKEYGPEFAERVVDAVSFLAAGDLPPLGPVPLRVALHDPCHARHGQGIVAEPRRLLARIPGLILLEPDEIEVCCGSGGAWGLRYPDLSADLARRKAGFLAATGADLVVTSNPGCLGQIADGLALEAPDLPILPLTDLLWYSAHQIN